MSWRFDSTAGANIWETQPLSDDELKLRDEEIVWLKQQGRRDWKVINGRLQRSGEPTMLEGTYGGLVAYPPAQDLTAVTGGTANVAWWTPALYTPLPANSVLSPEAYRIAATGRVTSSATTQTITPNANIGTAIGTGLGAGAAMSLGSATAVTNMLWFMLGDVTIRAAGSAGVAIGSFVLKITNAAGASTSIIQEIFGGAAAQTAIDFTGSGPGAWRDTVCCWRFGDAYAGALDVVELDTINPSGFDSMPSHGYTYRNCMGCGAVRGRGELASSQGERPSSTSPTLFDRSRRGGTVCCHCRHGNGARDGRLRRRSGSAKGLLGRTFQDAAHVVDQQRLSGPCADRHVRSLPQQEANGESPGDPGCHRRGGREVRHSLPAGPRIHGGEYVSPAQQAVAEGLDSQLSRMRPRPRTRGATRSRLSWN
jgi:hypothetical protein